MGLEPILHGPTPCVLGSTTSPIITNRFVWGERGDLNPHGPFGFQIHSLVGHQLPATITMLKEGLVGHAQYGYRLPPIKLSIPPLLSNRRDSNPRPHAPKARILPTELLLVKKIVGVQGLEPWTSWSQTRHATNCATPRIRL